MGVTQWGCGAQMADQCKMDWIEIAERARAAHHLAAAQNDGELYARSQRAFLAALDAAYPQWASTVEGHYHALYNLWLDSFESIEYYVEQIGTGSIEVSRWI